MYSRRSAAKCGAGSFEEGRFIEHLGYSTNADTHNFFVVIAHQDFRIVAIRFHQNDFVRVYQNKTCPCVEPQTLTVLLYVLQQLRVLLMKRCFLQALFGQLFKHHLQLLRINRF